MDSLDSIRAVVAAVNDPNNKESTRELSVRTGVPRSIIVRLRRHKQKKHKSNRREERYDRSVVVHDVEELSPIELPKVIVDKNQKYILCKSCGGFVQAEVPCYKCALVRRINEQAKKHANTK